ncbi:glycerophosphoryl diester phosphodiesterase [Kribbella flavida DSM 17836]|uniref:Glycerophosphoryl diester phosphodiesterase n=1 Tax=Kribbella flavida (strain DSM 17836 / JCM 10339 / NBRC 14399) TaxID=479435 RepID=D2PXZ0_KRIFD|nr:glycerophosphodiester phosphodiesterase family protein [Kribbella flavida]ADB33596.1 glycerophosphoryl diester phosphodiesterase [Kribbella flavida DSM 17836]
MRRLSRALLPLALTAGLLGPGLVAVDASATRGRELDLQAHRGGLGLTVESTIASFSRGLEVGVSTLELDIQITEDRHAVVTHDRRISAAKCKDTAPYTPGDPEYPYVGKYINTLTLRQVKQLDCGSLTQPNHPGQTADPGARMPELHEVFDLVRRYRAHGVTLNIETKVEAGAPTETAPREQFVQIVAGEVRKARIGHQVTIQSFDWGALMRMRQVAPELPIVALTNYDFLQTGQPGKSPWLGGIDIDDFGGDLVKATTSFGADAISPVHGFPQDGKIGDPAYRPYVTAGMVKDAHRAGLKVVPWTVNDPATMQSLVDKGVDGIISDYPDRLRTVARDNGYRLPKAYEAPAVRPLAAAHAHNDYEHRRPLQDALDRGFTSVEADVWLVDGELRVAHDLEDTVAGRTLESLYLQPLADRVKANHGRVYRHGRDFQLLIDIKSDGPSTYAAIHAALAKYRGISTIFVNGRTYPGAVTAVISGNRPLDVLKAQKVRYAGYDGRLTDLNSKLPASLMPLVSDNWTKHFTWQGVGAFPAAEREKLRTIVGTAHRAGYRVRFWATPDTRGAARDALWAELVAAGVDHLNTDDLHGLEDFLRS